MGMISEFRELRGQQQLTFLNDSNVLLVTAVHVQAMSNKRKLQQMIFEKKNLHFYDNSMSKYRFPASASVVIVFLYLS